MEKVAAIANRTGRISPFYYRPVKYMEEMESLDENLHDALIEDGDGRKKWILDIRNNPQPVSSYIGSLMQSKQYKHTKDLAMPSGKLVNPDAAVQKIVHIMRDGKILLLLSDSQEHVAMVDDLVRRQCAEAGIALEDPYQISAGDLCRYNAPANSRYSPLWPDGTQIYLHHRTSYVYRHLAYDLAEERSHSVDIRNLTVVEAGKYRCDQCQKGDLTVMWREPAQQKLCRHCFWLWELDHDE